MSITGWLSVLARDRARRRWSTLTAPWLGGSRTRRQTQAGVQLPLQILEAKRLLQDRNAGHVLQIRGALAQLQHVSRAKDDRRACQGAIRAHLIQQPLAVILGIECEAEDQKVRGGA